MSSPRPSFVRWVVVLVALLGTVVMACSGSSGVAAGNSNELDTLAAMPGTLSPELVRRAEEDGALSVYTSSPDMEEMVSEFEDRFDIDVSVYRAGSEALLQRVGQEAGANRLGADVIETGVGEMTQFSTDGLLDPYDSGLADTLRPGSTFDGWTADRYAVFTVAWNTDRVGPNGPPERWVDLADDRWNGQLALEQSDFDWYASLYRYFQGQGLGDGEIDGIFQRIAGGASVVTGHTLMAQLLSAGEFAVAASAYTDSVDDAIESGAPVDRYPAVEPLIIKAAGVGIVKGCRHPAAAALFTEWLLTDAQPLLLEAHRVPASTAVTDPIAGVDVINVDSSVVTTDAEQWSERYQELIG